MAKHSIDMLKINHVKSREDFVKMITTIGEMISNELPPSRKKWK